MKAQKKALVALFTELGYEGAAGWSDEKLNKRIQGLPEALKAGKEPGDGDSKQLFTQLLEAIDNGDDIEIEGGKNGKVEKAAKPAKASKNGKASKPAAKEKEKTKPSKKGKAVVGGKKYEIWGFASTPVVHAAGKYGLSFEDTKKLLKDHGITEITDHNLRSRLSVGRGASANPAPLSKEQKAKLLSYKGKGVMAKPGKEKAKGKK